MVSNTHGLALNIQNQEFSSVQVAALLLLNIWIIMYVCTYL